LIESLNQRCPYPHAARGIADLGLSLRFFPISFLSVMLFDRRIVDNLAFLPFSNGGWWRGIILWPFLQFFAFARTFKQKPAHLKRFVPKRATLWRLHGFSRRILQRDGGMGRVSVILVQIGTEW